MEQIQILVYDGYPGILSAAPDLLVVHLRGARTAMSPGTSTTAKKIAPQSLPLRGRDSVRLG